MFVELFFELHCSRTHFQRACKLASMRPNRASIPQPIFLLFLTKFVLLSLLLLQSPSTRCTKWRRAVSRTSSIGTPTAVSTRPAVSPCTTGTTWSPWTWWRLMRRRPGPGLPGCATWWLASAMKTRWPNGSARTTNIPFNVVLWSAVSWILSQWKHAMFLNASDVAEADFRGGRQERRRTPEHRRDLPAPPQAERQPAA